MDGILVIVVWLSNFKSVDWQHAKSKRLDRGKALFHDLPSHVMIPAINQCNISENECQKEPTHKVLSSSHKSERLLLPMNMRVQSQVQCVRNRTDMPTNSIITWVWCFDNKCFNKMKVTPRISGVNFIKFTISLPSYLQCIQVLLFSSDIACNVDTLDSIEYNEVCAFYILVLQLIEERGSRAIITSAIGQ